MQYIIRKSGFTKIAESKGVVQNANKTVTLEISDSQVPNSGILLKPFEQVAFNGTIYVRSVDGTCAEVRVGTFVPTGGSGGTSSGDNPSGDITGYNIATDEQIAELLNRNFPIQ